VVNVALATNSFTADVGRISVRVSQFSILNIMAAINASTIVITTKTNARGTSIVPIARADGKRLRRFAAFPEENNDYKDVETFSSLPLGRNALIVDLGDCHTGDPAITRARGNPICPLV